MREGFRSRCAFNRLDGDVLDLLFGLGELLFEHCDLLILPRDCGLQGFNLQLGDAALGLGIFFHQQNLLLHAGLGG